MGVGVRVRVTCALRNGGNPNPYPPHTCALRKGRLASAAASRCAAGAKKMAPSTERTARSESISPTQLCSGAAIRARACVGARGRAAMLRPREVSSPRRPSAPSASSCSSAGEGEGYGRVSGQGKVRVKVEGEG